MKSQNQYLLTFNPRVPKQKKIDQQPRYVPKLKNNLYANPPWKHGLQPQFQQDNQQRILNHPNLHRKIQKIALKHNDSGYLSNSNASNYSLSKRSDYQLKKQQQQRKKDEITKRVKLLHQKVMPLISNEYKDEEQMVERGWRSRIDLKLVRIETCLDNIKKEWQIDMQKKLMQIQMEWQSKFQEMIQYRQRQNHSKS